MGPGDYVTGPTKKCIGKWTHVIRTTGASSRLDYVLADSNAEESIENMIIDESTILCPFRIENKTKVLSDHNAILVKMKMEFQNQKRENKGNEQKVRWRLQPEGLLNLPEKSDEILHNGVQREHGTTQEVYDIWENKVHKIMDECFKRVRNNVETNRQTGGQIQMLARSINMFAKKGKAQRRVAKFFEPYFL